PILNAIANMTVAEGATTDQAVTGSDPDGDALTFTKAGGPSFLTVTTTSPTTGNIHLAPGFSDAGTYAASASASDGSLSDTKPFQITVTNVNRAPTLNAIANMTEAEGATADQAVTGSDPDGDALTFTKGSGPTFLTVTTTNATTGSIHVAPGAGAAAGSPYAASVTASDGTLGDTKPFQITVRLTNRAPTLNAIANMTVAEGATSDQGITGSDPDGDALTFTKAGGPSLLTVRTTNATTADIHLAPSLGNAATHAASASANNS